MLKITKNNYEIEETIQLTKNENNEEKVLYEFKMQLTPEDLLEIKHILFGYAKENKIKYQNSSYDEKIKLEEEAEKEIIKNNKRFEEICFKEHKDQFLKLAGEYKFEETVDEIRGFLLNFFMEKQTTPLNTTITNLTKISNNFPRFK